MTAMSHARAAGHRAAGQDTASALRRNLVIGLIAFLTVVDLFATQAILPSLTHHYGVTPAAMGFAVNASTIGMAAAGLVVAFFSRRIDYLIVKTENRTVIHHRREADGAIQTRIVRRGPLRLEPPGVMVELESFFPPQPL